MKKNNWLLLFLLSLSLLMLLACQPSSTGLAAVTPIPATISQNVAVTSAPVTAPAEYTPRPTFTIDPTRAALEATRLALPTPTPLAIRLPNAEVLAHMRATDEAMQPTPRAQPTPIEPERGDPPLIYFWELFDGYEPETGLILSDRIVSLDGQEIVMQGFMAPPLQLDLDWFMLTMAPMGACPFCSSADTVLPDTVLVYPVNEPTVYTWQGVRVRGVVEIGEASDPETGMVSLIRIYAEEIELGVTQ